MKGAVQIGYTRDTRAVWQRDDQQFIVVVDGQYREHKISVQSDEIDRRCEPPIPWESIAKHRGQP